MMRASSLLVPLSLLVIACGGESPSGGGGAGTTGVTPLAPPEVGMQIASEEITVPAGKQQYTCWSFAVPSNDPIALVGFESQVPDSGVHHYVVFTSTQPLKEAGPYDCDSMDAAWVPITGGTVGAPSVKFPDEAALPLPKSQHIVLQLDLLNTTMEDLTVAPVRINLLGTNDANKQPVGLLVAGTHDIMVPAQGTDVTAYGGCALDEAMDHVFAVFPHMHQLGKRIVARNIPQGQSPVVIADQVWDFKAQGRSSVEASVGKGDVIDVTCHFDNPTDTDVGFGLGSADEMCVDVLFYYPAMTLAKYCGLSG
jgi:hypothetical protein